MTLLNGGALALLASAAGIVLLYFLRARSVPYQVPALFLWEGLRHDPQSRAARLRRRIEPLLLLQLLILFLLTFALAEPAIRQLRPSLSGMALILDGSASMQTETATGKTRYDLALEEGLSFLEEFPSTPVTILQLSHASQVLVPLTDDHAKARQLLSASQPTWFGKGSADTLQGLLESQGGSDAFERIVLLTDHTLETPLTGIEQVIFHGGENVAITAFTVREDKSGYGVSAFVKIRNYTDSYQQRLVRVSDSANSTVVSAFIPPDTTQSYTLPFPGSIGPSFTAALEPGDAFSGDDVRHFTISKPLELRIRWVGDPNRYLKAALAAAMPVVFISGEDKVPVDLTVACNVQLPADTTGNILLSHAGLEGIVKLEQDLPAGELSVGSTNDPLLLDVDPLDFRVSDTPRVEVPESGTTVLSLGENPFLYRVEQDDRNLVLIAPDLLQTNLPLTVDFSLLIRNIVGRFTPLPAPITYTWSVVGEPIQLDGYGAIGKLEDPDGQEISLPESADSFIPQMPGVYSLQAARGTYFLAANVDPSESQLPKGSPVTVASQTSKQRAQILHPIWQYLALAGLFTLLLEAGIYHGWRLRWFK